MSTCPDEPVIICAADSGCALGDRCRFRHDVADNLHNPAEGLTP